jgi:hypothetical protein
MYLIIHYKNGEGGGVSDYSVEWTPLLVIKKVSPLYLIGDIYRYGKYYLYLLFNRP